MNIHDRTRSLAMAATLALTIAGFTVAQVHAAPNTTPQGRCEANGGVWDLKKQACATRSCQHEGLPYRHGDTVTQPGTGPGHIKLRTTYKCNGFTGLWEQVASIQAAQTEPSAPADVPVYSR